MDKLLGTIPLIEEIRVALLERKGNLGFYLSFCEDYESANWQRITARTARLGLNEEKVSQLYRPPPPGSTSNSRRWRRQINPARWRPPSPPRPRYTDWPPRV